MATTTTTKRKKKLIYKQDADGVFRLKKVDDTDHDTVSTTTTELLERKTKVDNYLNELMDCSYTIEDDLKKNSASDTNPLDSVAKHQQTGPKSKKCKKIKPTTNNTSSKNLKTSSSPPSSPSSSPQSLSSPSSTKSPPSTSPITAQKSKPKKKSIFSPLTVKLTSTMAKAKQVGKQALRFHVPSFLLGIVSTIMGTVFKKELILLTIGLVVTGIVLAVLGVAGLVACLYLGWIKQEDIKIVDLALTYMETKFNFNPLNKKLHADDDSGEEDEEEEEQEGQQEEEEEDEEEVDETVEIIQEYAQNRSKPRSKPATTTATKYEPPPSAAPQQRQSKTKVTPYRCEREPRSPYGAEKSPKHESLPDFGALQNRSRTSSSQDVPALQRINSAPLRSMPKQKQSPSHYQPIIPSPPVTSSKRTRNNSVESGGGGGGGSSPSFTKLFPTLSSQAEELPLINEVKLVDSITDDFEEEPALVGHSTNPFTRQQSILGTRDHYKKFVANANH
ncbi:uncharacterized protein LODBEIA_P22740 [Lodderomyces beijingensis]|uniref:Uncharacterized protein n=1 Tax=Lodderomyces beijingensis TaxID=1775926 RepID=A0ABP0ZIT1_9ASCO